GVSRPPRSPPFPCTTLFRSAGARFVELGPVGLTPASAQLLEARASSGAARPRALRRLHLRTGEAERLRRVVAEKAMAVGLLPLEDRKSTRLNSSRVKIAYAG